MSKLLRYYKPGQIYFVTAVTNNRRPILKNYADLLLEIIKYYKNKIRFDLLAWVILPDHFHVIINPKKKNLSDIMRRIKISFSYKIRRIQNVYSKTVWQKRFWDHIIRDENDLNIHIDYIHYNPIKHGLVDNPSNWEYSSFDNYLKGGFYEKD